jgi:hypothetical protein
MADNLTALRGTQMDENQTPHGGSEFRPLLKIREKRSALQRSAEDDAERRRRSLAECPTDASQRDLIRRNVMKLARTLDEKDCERITEYFHSMELGEPAAEARAIAALDVKVKFAEMAAAHDLVLISLEEEADGDVKMDATAISLTLPGEMKRYIEQRAAEANQTVGEWIVSRLLH